MSIFGVYVKFKTHAGQREALVQTLLEAAAAMHNTPECHLYIVNQVETEPDTVWVTEIWANEAAQKAALTMPESRAMIQQAMPLIAGVEQIRLIPVGGKAPGVEFGGL